MKLKNLHQIGYMIYCDLDGVLADFRKKCIEVLDIDPDAIDFDKDLKDEFWTRLRLRGQNGHKLWEELEFMPDALSLWQYISRYNPIICTASGGLTNAEIEKRNWVQKMLGNVETIVVNHSHDKSAYAHKMAILIDDQHRSINPWIAKEGIGILHESAARTIEKLKSLGL